MNEYISISHPITPEWLTAVFRQSRALRQGEVRAVEWEMTGAFNSQTSHLFIHYSADANPDAPTRVVLKQNIQGSWGMVAGVDEVKFYNAVAALPDHPPIIIPCYAAASDKQSGNSYLLLQDLSETHHPPVTRDQQISIVNGMPHPVDIVTVVDTLALLHTYWWNHALLGTDTFDVGYWTRNAERFEQYFQRRKTSWESLILKEDVWFPDDLRRLYEQVFAHLPQYWERYLEPRFRAKKNLTLVHGDAYFANFLCPREPGTAITYLLDWQSASFDIGGLDLVNLCATFWTPQQRHEGQREENILRRYHTVLQAHGVDNYSWDDLITDYQIGLVGWLLMPVQDCYNGSRKEYWWPKMQCLVAAFQEWRCGDLLGI